LVAVASATFISDAANAGGAKAATRLAASAAAKTVFNMGNIPLER
jgi:hypothetical protein